MRIDEFWVAGLRGTLVEDTGVVTFVQLGDHTMTVAEWEEFRDRMDHGITHGIMEMESNDGEE
jgi:hypothetical protein